jgi:hypothetical protein
LGDRSVEGEHVTSGGVVVRERARVAKRRREAELLRLVQRKVEPVVLGESEALIYRQL